MIINIWQLDIQSIMCLFRIQETKNDISRECDVGRQYILMQVLLFVLIARYHAKITLIY